MLGVPPLGTACSRASDGMGHFSNAFLLGTTWGSHSGGLSQQLGAQVACCRPPGTGKQLWDPTLLLALYLCSPSTVPALPGRLAKCAIVSAVTVTASIHGYTKAHLLVKRENKAAFTSAWCFLKQGCLQGCRLSSVMLMPELSQAEFDKKGFN